MNLLWDQNENNYIRYHIYGSSFVTFWQKSRFVYWRSSLSRHLLPSSSSVRIGACLLLFRPLINLPVMSYRSPRKYWIQPDLYAHIHIHAWIVFRVMSQWFKRREVRAFVKISSSAFKNTRKRFIYSRT